MELALEVGQIALFVFGVLTLLLAAGFLWEAMSEAFERKPPPGSLVDVGGGQKLHVVCRGDAPGPTVVLEMGAMEPAPYWWGIRDEVAKFARVCCYDRAGFGWSPPPTNPQSMEDRAAELHRVLTAAGEPGPFVLVGHSFGGPLIRLFARNHPDAAAGFVFIDTPDESTIYREGYLAFVRRRMKPMIVAAGLARRFGITRLVSIVWPNNRLTPQFGKEARDALAATRSPNMFRAAKAEFDAILNAPEALRRPHGFGGPLRDKPVVVMTHGIRFPAPYDVLEVGWDEGQKSLAALSTNSELIVAEKSTHLIQIDEPDLVIAAIRRVFVAARDGARLNGARARHPA